MSSTSVQIFLAATFLLGACRSGGQVPGRVRIPAPTATSGAHDAQAQPRILSAHLAERGAPELGGRDGILIVFSEPLDPATLLPQMLVVVSHEGQRMNPDRAVLSPAKWGVTRTVLLVGDFTAEEREPTDVVIVGPLFTERGVSLRGVSGQVEPHDAPDRLVLAHRLEADDLASSGCTGAQQVVRTYWSDRLSRVEKSGDRGLLILLSDATEHTPIGIEAIGAGGASTSGNVLDLCLTADVSAQRLRVAAGAFQDAAGHRNAAIEVPIADPPERWP